MTLGNLFAKPTAKDLRRRGQSLEGGRDLGDAFAERLCGHTAIRKGMGGGDTRQKSIRNEMKETGLEEACKGRDACARVTREA